MLVSRKTQVQHVELFSLHKAPVLYVDDLDTLRAELSSQLVWPPPGGSLEQTHPDMVEDIRADHTAVHLSQTASRYLATWLPVNDRHRVI